MGRVHEIAGKSVRKRTRGETKPKATTSVPADEPKRARVHAQRKFAQGAGGISPHPSPVKELRANRSRTDNGSSSSSCSSGPTFLPKGERPKTEDFLTFLCLRGTDFLPPELDFFNQATPSNATVTSDDELSDGDRDHVGPEKASTAKKSALARKNKDKKKAGDGVAKKEDDQSKSAVTPTKQQAHLRNSRSPLSVGKKGACNTSPSRPVRKGKHDVKQMITRSTAISPAAKKQAAIKGAAIKAKAANNKASSKVTDRTARLARRTAVKKSGEPIYESSDEEETTSEDEDEEAGENSAALKSESEADADEEPSSRESSQRPKSRRSDEGKLSKSKESHLSRLKQRVGRSTSHDSSGSKDSIVAVRPSRKTKEVAKNYLNKLGQKLAPKKRESRSPEGHHDEVSEDFDAKQMLDVNHLDSGSIKDSSEMSSVSAETLLSEDKAPIGDKKTLLSIKDGKERKKEKKRNKTSLKDLQNILLEEAKRKIDDARSAADSSMAGGAASNSNTTLSPADSDTADSEERITISQRTGYISVKPRKSVDSLQSVDLGDNSADMPPAVGSGRLFVKGGDRAVNNPTPPRRILPKSDTEQVDDSRTAGSPSVAAGNNVLVVGRSNHHLPAGVIGAAGLSSRNAAAPVMGGSGHLNKAGGSQPMTGLVVSSMAAGSSTPTLGGYAPPIVIQTSHVVGPSSQNSSSSLSVKPSSVAGTFVAAGCGPQQTIGSTPPQAIFVPGPPPTVQTPSGQLCRMPIPMPVQMTGVRPGAGFPLPVGVRALASVGGAGGPPQVLAPGGQIAYQGIPIMGPGGAVQFGIPVPQGATAVPFSSSSGGTVNSTIAASLPPSTTSTPVVSSLSLRPIDPPLVGTNAGIATSGGPPIVTVPTFVRQSAPPPAVFSSDLTASSSPPALNVGGRNMVTTSSNLIPVQSAPNMSADGHTASRPVQAGQTNSGISGGASASMAAPMQKSAESCVSSASSSDTSAARPVQTFTMPAGTTIQYNVSPANLKSFHNLPIKVPPSSTVVTDSSLPSSTHSQATVRTSSGDVKSAATVSAPLPVVCVSSPLVSPGPPTLSPQIGPMTNNSGSGPAAKTPSSLADMGTRRSSSKIAASSKDKQADGTASDPPPLLTPPAIATLAGSSTIAGSGDGSTETSSTGSGSFKVSQTLSAAVDDLPSTVGISCSITLSQPTTLSSSGAMTLSTPLTTATLATATIPSSLPDIIHSSSSASSVTQTTTEASLANDDSLSVSRLSTTVPTRDTNNDKSASSVTSPATAVTSSSPAVNPASGKKSSVSGHSMPLSSGFQPQPHVPVSSISSNSTDQQPRSSSHHVSVTASDRVSNGGNSGSENSVNSRVTSVNCSVTRGSSSFVQYQYSTSSVKTSQIVSTPVLSSSSSPKSPVVSAGVRLPVPGQKSTSATVSGSASKSMISTSVKTSSTSETPPTSSLQTSAQPDHHPPIKTERPTPDRELFAARTDSTTPSSSAVRKRPEKLIRAKTTSSTVQKPITQFNLDDDKSSPYAFDFDTDSRPTPRVPFRQTSSSSPVKPVVTQSPKSSSSSAAGPVRKSTTPTTSKSPLDKRAPSLLSSSSSRPSGGGGGSSTTPVAAGAKGVPAKSPAQPEAVTPPTKEQQRSKFTAELKKETSSSISVDIDPAFEEDDPKRNNDTTEEGSSSDNETTYFIPLNTSGQSFGVAVKLGTDGPSGPNQKVIMTAKLVTNSDKKPIKAKILGTSSRTIEAKVAEAISRGAAAASAHDKANSRCPPASAHDAEHLGSRSPRAKTPPSASESASSQRGTPHKLRMPVASPVSPTFSSDLSVSAITDATHQRNLPHSSSRPGGKPSHSNLSSKASVISNVMGGGSMRSGALSSASSKKRPMCLIGNVLTGQRFPRLGQHAQLMEAPTFRPSEDEFKDPLRYIQKIRRHAEQFGMCRIIPPRSFKPDCNLDDDMRFTAYNQYIDRMFSRWGQNSKETAAIKRYLDTQNVDTRSHPLVGGLEVDLPALYHAVQSFGGLSEVIQKKKWGKIAEYLRVARGTHASGNKLDDIYVKWLLPYDMLSNVEREELIRLVGEEWCEQSKERMEKEKKREEGLMDSEEDDELEQDEDEDQEAVVKGKSTSLAAFYRLSRNLMCTVFRDTDEPAPHEAEDEYWKIVNEKDVHMQVSQGSIDTGIQGYGFPIRNSNYSSHPWNLKMLTKNPRSVLQAMGSVMGVTQPTLHLGMLFTTGCWYRDPHGLPWIDYLHSGAPKIWYGIPDHHSLAFYTAMKQLVPHFCKNRRIWLPSDTTMVSPSLLVKHGVSVSRAVQQPGQFVVVFPKSYTSSISTGYCVSESVYFAMSDWLSEVDTIFQDIKDSMEPMMFPLEKFLYSAATFKHSTRMALLTIKEKIEKINRNEISNREKIAATGIKKFERLKLQREKKYEEDDEYECELCNANLYLSLVVNEEEETTYCLEHGLDHIKFNKRRIKQCKFMYTHTKDEMLDILKKIQRRLDAHEYEEEPEIDSPLKADDIESHEESDYVDEGDIKPRERSLPSFIIKKEKPFISSESEDEDEDNDTVKGSDRGGADSVDLDQKSQASSSTTAKSSRGGGRGRSRKPNKMLQQYHITNDDYLDDFDDEDIPVIEALFGDDDEVIRPSGKRQQPKVRKPPSESSSDDDDNDENSGDDEDEDEEKTAVGSEKSSSAKAKKGGPSAQKGRPGAAGKKANTAADSEKKTGGVGAKKSAGQSAKSAGGKRPLSPKRKKASDKKTAAKEASDSESDQPKAKRGKYEEKSGAANKKAATAGKDSAAKSSGADTKKGLKAGGGKAASSTASQSSAAKQKKQAVESDKKKAAASNTKVGKKTPTKTSKADKAAGKKDGADGGKKKQQSSPKEVSKKVEAVVRKRKSKKRKAKTIDAADKFNLLDIILTATDDEMPVSASEQEEESTTSDDDWK